MQVHVQEESQLKFLFEEDLETKEPYSHIISLSTFSDLCCKHFDYIQDIDLVLFFAKNAEQIQIDGNCPTTTEFMQTEFAFWITDNLIVRWSPDVGWIYSCDALHALWHLVCKNIKD